MSWMVKLYETYDKALSNSELPNYPAPYFHAKEGCHIEITIDDKGYFKSAQSLVTEIKYGKKTDYKKTRTIIPITPKSLTGRTSGSAPYPLAEKLQYIAKDYAAYGGIKAPYFPHYVSKLQKWANHEQYSHWKVKAILEYVMKGTVIEDLVGARQLFVTESDSKPELITKWKDQAEKGAIKPPLIQSITGGEQGNAIIRWVVQKEGEANDTTWEDNELIESWQSYASSIYEENGFCQILGRDAFLTSTHPKAIYPQAINAKLISMPTDKGYLTYQGKFTNDSQPVGISFEASQKAHNTLRWLIERGQGKFLGISKGNNRPAVIVSWAISGTDTPHPLEDVWGLLKNNNEIEENSTSMPVIENYIDNTIDFGQSFSIELGKYLNGYKAKLKNSGNIVIMGLDSATDGRMAVTYYQEIFPDEYIERISKWHKEFSWYQRHKINKNIVWPVYAPSPNAISEMIYGNIIGDDVKQKLKKNAIERILSCIVEARPFPQDLKEKAVQRVTNRSAYKSEKQLLWEEHLGIACALYRGFCKRDLKQNKEYIVGLEQENNSRDYLYGRLLAIAERVEDMSLYVSGEKRSTTAARLMQRFADRPASTWRNIELALQPYMQRLKNNRAGFLHNIQTLLDEVMGKFIEGDFVNDKPLSGEFLLAYHTQRFELRSKKQSNENDESQTDGDE